MVGRLKRTRDNRPGHCSLNLGNKVYDVFVYNFWALSAPPLEGSQGKVLLQSESLSIKALLVFGAKGGSWFLLK